MLIRQGLTCRYQEAHDRGIRARELADRLRVAEINRDLAEARESQQAARLRAQAEMANIEAAEFARVLAENKKAEQLRLVQVSPHMHPSQLREKASESMAFGPIASSGNTVLFSAWSGYFQAHRPGRQWHHLVLRSS